MKKIIKILIPVLFIISASYIVNAENIAVYLNGKELKFDVAPTVINDRTMIPMRAIFEALGATVEWNESTQTVKAKKNNDEILLTINNKVLLKNGKKITLDVPAVIIDNRTLVPIRAVSEALNAIVNWSDKNNAIIISNNGIKYYNDYPDVPDFGDYYNEKNINELIIDENTTTYVYSLKGNIISYYDELKQNGYSYEESNSTNESIIISFINNKNPTTRIIIEVKNKENIYIKIKAKCNLLNNEDEIENYLYSNYSNIWVPRLKYENLKSSPMQYYVNKISATGIYEIIMIIVNPDVAYELDNYGEPACEDMEKWIFDVACDIISKTPNKRILCKVDNAGGYKYPALKLEFHNKTYRSWVNYDENDTNAPLFFRKNAGYK